MTAPPLYLDECVNPNLVVVLRQRGFVATSAREQRTLGLTDDAHLAFAASIGHIIVTHDNMDFHRLHRRRNHAGILTLPNPSPALTALRLTMLTHWITAAPDHANQFYRWNDLQTALIRGEHLPGFTDDEIRRALGQR